MIQRIKTSSKTAENLDEIQNKYHFSTKAAILRACIAISLKIGDVSFEQEEADFSNGFDISLPTLFGDSEIYYRCMIKYLANEDLNDSDYLDHIVSHIERGMAILYGEFSMTHSLKELIEKIV